MAEVYICEFCQRAYEPEEVNGVRKLKEFKGFTVDLRLQEFRKITLGKLLFLTMNVGPTSPLFDTLSGTQVI
jgi:hypothetical protein